MRDDGVWKQLETILVGLNTGLLNDIDTSRVVRISCRALGSTR